MHKKTKKILVAVLACVTVCSPAYAKSPTGDFAGLGKCPRFTPGDNLCLLSHVTSGEVKVGNTIVPIARTMTLQGGVIEEEKEPFAETFVDALGGETLSKTPLQVPGGLSAIVNPGSLPQSLLGAFERDLNGGLATVTATTELVGIPQISTSNLEYRMGTALSLPVRMMLANPFLGSECYIGSRLSPIVLELTSGSTSPPVPNKPIAGKVGRLHAKDDFELIEDTGDSLVDNSFAVPRATGCGGSYAVLLDAVIDTKLGLPSQGGRNTAILNDTLLEAATGGVIASEK